MKYLAAWSSLVGKKENFRFVDYKLITNPSKEIIYRAERRISFIDSLSKAIAVTMHV